MTEKEYKIICLLIDRNTAVKVGYYEDSKVMYQENIQQLKADLSELIDKEKDNG